MANDRLLTVLLQEYETLSAEFRTLLVVGFVLLTILGGAVVTALTVAYGAERQEILVIFPAIAIGVAIALVEVRKRYLSLETYLAGVEERINGALAQASELGWHRRAMKEASPTSGAGAVGHSLGISFAATALFLLLLALGSRYIADFDHETWELALYISVFASSYVVLWCNQVLYRFFVGNSQLAGVKKDPSTSAVEALESPEARAQ